MRGRDVFMNSLVAHGVEHVFGNPGTTESPFLDALHDYPSISYVTCLHEGTVLAEGSIDQVSENERVIEVYLGR